MSSSEINDLEREFAAAIYLSKAPSRDTLYPYLYIFTQGRGGGNVEPERRGEGQQGRVQIANLG
jgi:hypothetical protein